MMFAKNTSGYVYMSLAALLLVMNSKQIYDTRYGGGSVTDHAQQMIQDYQMNVPVQDFVQELVRLQTSKYIDLHVIPVFLWVILLFLQMSKFVRRRIPQRLHELLGILFLGVSAVMILGISLMYFSGEQMYGENDFQWDPLGQPAKFFTFTSASVVFSIWWIICGIQLWRYATPATRSLHKQWVRRFVATGLGTGTMRILFIFYCQTYHSIREGGTPLEKEEGDRLTGVTMWAGFILNIVVNEITAPKYTKIKKK